jgi:hypothetical protein
VGKSAPKPPDPKVVAAAQTGTNVSTATANAWLGNINEYTPDGSTTFAQNGSQSIYDPSVDKTYSVPTFNRTTTLSPAQQAIKAQQDAASLNLSTLGNNLTGTLGSQLTGNFKLDNESTEGRLFDLGRKRLDPMFAEKQSALDAKLAAQGIGLGTKQFETAKRMQSQSENDAYNQLLLTGRGQAAQEQLTEDNQRINQISALLNGGQVSQPQFMGANMPTIPTTDFAGITQQSYQNQLAAWQQEQAMAGQMIGGLFSMGAGMISDRRLKKNVKRIGWADNGLPIYSYQYVNDSPFMIGFMADEVEEVHPEAVVEVEGIKTVNYELAVQ